MVQEDFANDFELAGQAKRIDDNHIVELFGSNLKMLALARYVFRFLTTQPLSQGSSSCWLIGA
jgi:hypothetical protein